MHLPDNYSLQNGKYRIIRFISAGGFGCTYEALHVRLNKRIAIKEFFINDFCNRDHTNHEVSVGTESKRPLVDKLRDKFIREAQSLSGMSHPGIVTVHDVFDENGTAYYVMDFIEGKSIADLLKQGPMSEATAVRYITQVCEALRYVHSKGIMHLDIKPGNIMVDGEGNAVLIDFGTAKQYDMASGENTSTLLGLTPGYAPPEQMRHKVTNFTPATDIYALGATLYKMLTGITPPDPVAIAAGEQLEPLPSTISPSTRRAIAEAMQLNVTNRPQSVDEFMAILKGGGKAPVQKDDVTVIDRPVKRPQSDKTVYGPVTERAADRNQPITKPTKKKGWLIPAIVAAVVVVGAILALFSARLLSSPEDNDDLVAVADTLTEVVESPTVPVATAESEVKPEPVQVETPTSAAEPKQDPATVETPAPKPDPKQDLAPTSKPDQAPAYNNDYSVSGNSSGHDYVDLGLSVKWATCNVGASTPSGYGWYFEWGETSTYDGHSIWYPVSYEDLKSQGVINSSGNLTRQYDAAAANWGGSWRMPTLKEMKELLNKCTWTWTKLDGKNGYKVTGPNGNSLFLPAAGDRNHNIGLPPSEGSEGSYWSSRAHTDDLAGAVGLGFDSSKQSWVCDRYYGRSVRPVVE